MSQDNYYKSNRRIKPSHRQTIENKKKIKDQARLNNSGQVNHQDRVEIHTILPNRPIQQNMENNMSFLAIGGWLRQPTLLQSNLEGNLSLRNPLNTSFQSPKSSISVQNDHSQRSFGRPQVLERLQEQRRQRNQLGINYERPPIANPIKQKSNIFQTKQKVPQQQPQSIFELNIPMPSPHIRPLPNPINIQNQMNKGNQPRKIFNPNNRLLSPMILPTINEQQSEQNSSNGHSSIASRQQERIPQQINFPVPVINTFANQSPMQSYPNLNNGNQLPNYEIQHNYNSNAYNINTQTHIQGIIPTQENTIYHQQQNTFYNNYQQPNMYNFQQPQYSNMPNFYQHPQLIPQNLNPAITHYFNYNTVTQTFYLPNLGVPQEHIKWLQNLDIDFNWSQFAYPFQQIQPNPFITNSLPALGNMDFYSIFKFLVGQQISNNATTNIYLVLDALRKIIDSFKKQQDLLTENPQMANVHVRNLQDMLPYFASIKKWQKTIRLHLEQLRQQDQILKQRKLQKMHQKILNFKKNAMKIRMSNILMAKIQKTNQLIKDHTRTTLQLFQAYQTGNRFYRFFYPDQPLIKTVQFMLRNYLSLRELTNQLELIQKAQQCTQNPNKAKAQMIKNLLQYFTSLCGSYTDLKQKVTPRLKTKRVLPISQQSSRQMEMFRLLKQMDEAANKLKNYNEIK